MTKSVHELWRLDNITASLKTTATAASNNSSYYSFRVQEDEISIFREMKFTNNLNHLISLSLKNLLLGAGYN